MSEIRVHIERLVLDGLDLTATEAATVQVALSAAVQEHLLSGVLAHPHASPVASSAHAALRTAPMAAAREHGALGQAAGRALAATLSPLCVGAGRATPVA
jgi:hypothetical protein